MERWASFDCYGTLIDWDTGIRQALGELWPDHDADQLLEIYHRTEPLIQADVAIPYREVLALTTRAVATELGSPLADGGEHQLPESLPEWPPFPEALDALGELRRRGWRLAVLSNTDPDLLAASLSRVGVAVDLTITVAQAGGYKPAPGHWRAFRERSAADPGRHVHVAASLFHDIEPCARLGITAVWINRLGERTHLPFAAELPDLSRLADLLDEIEPA